MRTREAMATHPVLPPRVSLGGSAMPTKHLALALQAHALDWHGFTGPYYWVPAWSGPVSSLPLPEDGSAFPRTKPCQAQIREAAQ